ncbi:MAG: hypothetical protein A3A73_02240 [Omnitrophica bacterium RIFCSPLOWO2_01_FULL_50_24]|nr:MAG: hypothetical protein A3A73_02240 [Omnitrophica bacterium RIFCSPLOWO2_01_FULL_50_24]
MRMPAALILAAGRGERMNSDVPKVLHEAAGVPLLEHVISTVREAGIQRIYVVVGRNASKVRSLLTLNGVKTVVQKQQLGTGHAVLQAERALKDHSGDLLVLPADAPCLRAETVREFIRSHRNRRVRASILTALTNHSKGYGRILRRSGQIQGIREELEASPAERDVAEINSGIYLFDTKLLFRKLREVKRNPRKKERYLTDVIEVLVHSGNRVRAHRVRNGQEVLGVNTRSQLSMAHQIIGQRELERHSRNGVTIQNPSQTFVAKGVRIGRDTIIFPFTWIGPGVVIGRNCEIGPFAKLKARVRVGNGVTVGSFVELVRSEIGERTCIKHLSYLGDTKVGRKVNIGAGTITANFDGKRKHRTVIQDGALIGSNTVLVAPVTIGRKAKTGAGAVVVARHPVPSGKTVVGVPARIMTTKKRGSKG